MSGPDLAVEPAPRQVRRRASPSGVAALVRGTFRAPQAKVGLALIVAVLVVAFVGPLFATTDPAAIIGPPYAAAGGGFPLGTDGIGRDVLSRFLHGGSAILITAFLATVVGVGVGTLLGLVAGYRRGAWGQAIMRTLDIVLSFPPLLLALLFVSLLGAQLWLILLTVAVSHIPYVARVMESSALAVTGRSFVEYTEMIGIPRRRIVVGEILPNVVAPLTVQFGLRLTYSISLIASLAYLGFGRSAPEVDWGMMINENQANITLSPLPVLLPVVAVAVVTIGVNLVTDGFGRAAGIDLGKEDPA